MRKTIGFAAAGLMLSAGAALADGPRVYAYPAENFCPAGLQPVTISGAICCGVPNQTVSYSSMKATPAPKKKRVYRQAATGYVWHGGKGVNPDY